MANYTVVAFYTPDYEEMVRELERDCIELELPFKCKAYPDTGSWVRNAGLKPSFILGMLQELKGDILYVDADARIRQAPIFLDRVKSVGVHYRNGQELLSGTIFLRNIPWVYMLVQQWAREQSAFPEVWDQKTLDSVLSRELVTELPPTYTQIFDTMAHHGRPVIEHFQASRGKRVRHVPAETVGNVRIRKHGDGTSYISRYDKKAIEYMDARARRVPGQLRWYPIPVSSLEDLRPVFYNQIVNIVGKGASLDNLCLSDLADGPIIGLNEAALVVDKLGHKVYGLQQDSRLLGECRPPNGEILVSLQAARFYPEAYIFDTRDYGLPVNTLSVLAAIQISKSLGVRGFRMLCFDACVSGNTEYAECVGYNSTRGGVPGRFLTHRHRIEALVGPMPTEWVTPEARAEASDDIPQLS